MISLLIGMFGLHSKPAKPELILVNLAGEGFCPGCGWKKTFEPGLRRFCIYCAKSFEVRSVSSLNGSLSAREHQAYEKYQQFVAEPPKEDLSKLPPMRYVERRLIIH